MEVIPALDLLDGRCVRLYQGDYEKVTHYDVDVLATAARYLSAGLTRLHTVDLDGARDGLEKNRKLITRLVRSSGLRVQVGGGVRSRDTAMAWLESGVERVVVGSAAVTDPEGVLGWLPVPDAYRLLPAFDVRAQTASGEPQVVTHGWKTDSGRGLWTLMELYVSAGIREFLCTDVTRDGTLAGPNTGLYAEARRRFPTAELIASGGIGSRKDLVALAASGVDAVVTGRALLDGRLTLEEAGTFSRAG